MEVLGSKELKGEGEKGLLTEKQWAVVRYTDAMTRDVSVGEEVFGELKRLFSEQEVVEITATVRFSSPLYSLSNLGFRN